MDRIKLKNFILSCKLLQKARPYKVDVLKVISHCGMMMKTQALMMILNTESSQSQSIDLLPTQKSAGRKCKNINQLGG